MAGRLFWLSDAAWIEIERHLPKNQAGAHRVDDRRVISGIVHMLKCGGRWRDCPADYGPSTTIYNRWNRWSRRGVWGRILAALTDEGWIAETAQIDRSYVKTHRAPVAQKGGRANAYGVSHGRRMAKIHALADLLGRPLRLALTTRQDPRHQGHRPARRPSGEHEAPHRRPRL
jgi:transposase